jgi:outer membrane protein insertion porin family
MPCRADTLGPLTMADPQDTPVSRGRARPLGGAEAAWAAATVATVTTVTTVATAKVLFLAGARFLAVLAMAIALFGGQLAAAAATAPATAPAQDIDDQTLADRPVSQVLIRGLNRVTEQEVRNNLRIAAGQPFDAEVVRKDVSTLYRLGHFEEVTAEAELQADGSVHVLYQVSEQAIVRAIQFVGNSLVTDQDLAKAVPLSAGTPRDDFLLEQSVFRIKELYRDRGNFLAEVTVDETRLRDDGILIFRIVEGPRVRIREIEFVGNASFDSDELGAQIATKPWVFLFRKGDLDHDRLIDDVAKLDTFYKDHGYMDVRVDRRVELSNDQSEAKVVFVVSEGRQYRLRNFVVEGAQGQPLKVFSRSQLVDLSIIQRGDPYQKNLIDKTIKAIEQAYQVMGYIDIRVDYNYVRVGEEPEVDMLITAREGEGYITGLVTIQGNFITRDKVIRRLVRFQPGRPMDGREFENTKARLEASQLFREPRITPQNPTQEEPNVRDVLVEVKEKQTGSMNFGVGAGTDSGFFGDISVTQNNFDIADWPQTFDELVNGRAFRGAGQTFRLAIQPGIDVSNFNLSIGEPHLFDTDIGANTSVNYRIRAYDNYDEERLTGLFTIGRRIGDFWSISATPRVENVQLTNFDGNTPIEIFRQRGPSYISAVSFSLTRTEVDNVMRPSRGTQFEFEASYHGAFGGDYTYPQVGFGITQFFTTYEDFLGRKQILRLKANTAYIFSQSAPVFERFYLGGRSLRGFDYRTVSPKAVGTINNPTIATDDPVGGQFMFFAGAQYEIPVFGEFLSVVAFVDSGTVNNDQWLGAYRVGIGAGLRLYIPQFGQAPIALDFAYPILKQEFDEEQIFSFTIDLPF